MKLYKLTDEKGQTRGGVQWGENVTHTATGDATQDLCSDGWIHAYTSPLLAVLLNPIHANFASPKLFEATGEVGKRDGQLKVGVRSLTTVKEIPLPSVTDTQRIAFGILCALEVCKDAEFTTWAKDWLTGKDRGEKAASAVASAASSARGEARAVAAAAGGAAAGAGRGGAGGASARWEARAGAASAVASAASSARWEARAVAARAVEARAVAARAVEA